MKHQKLIHISSIWEIHSQLGLPKPNHPLVSVVDYSNVESKISGEFSFTTDFYMVCIKRDYKGKLKYGQKHYDFDEGSVSFIAPQQVIYEENENPSLQSGTLILFHRDFITNYPLATKIESLAFFDYDVNEALHLSSQEERLIKGIMNAIASETSYSHTDLYNQAIIIAQLELLFTYCGRFYSRQFITRHQASAGILINFEHTLKSLLNTENIEENGTPTVKQIAGILKMSPGYMSDMLKNITGMTTQEHIHNRLILLAKERLANTELSVGEIAYSLGFEYPQSFSKLFRKKTQQTPKEFRKFLFGTTGDN